MIIGRGDIATAIKDREGYTFYVNGVSNRTPITDVTASNEVVGVSACDKECMFVYVSTLSIYYSNSEYTRHKVMMENLIRKNFDNYAIIRIGNIKWGDNPNTLLNNLSFKIHNGQTFRTLDEYRYLIDREEFQHWLSMIPRYGKHEMNITGQRYKVKEIVKMIKDGRI